MNQLPVCQLFGSILALQTLSIACHKSFHNVGIQYVKYLINTVCMYVFVLCVLVVLFRYWALEWVMVPDSTGLYVGLVGWGGIHCKFLSTFRGCVLPNESVCKFSCFVWAYQTYNVCKWCILYCFWMIFVLVFCLCFMYKFHYILESVYWFHSIVVPLAYVTVWCCACYFVRFDVSAIFGQYIM